MDKHSNLSNPVSDEEKCFTTLTNIVIKLVNFPNYNEAKQA